MPPKTHLYIDWDGTITTTDTMSLVGSIAYSKGVGPDVPAWSHFVDGYMDDYAAHKEAYEPRKTERTSIEEEMEWLESLEVVDRMSALRVEEAGLFNGITAEDFVEGARGVAPLNDSSSSSCETSASSSSAPTTAASSSSLAAREKLGEEVVVEEQGREGRETKNDQEQKKDHPGDAKKEKPRLVFRAGLLDLLRKIYDTGGDAAVVSVNWSGCFIASVLRHALGAEVTKSLTVYANEIECSSKKDAAGKLSRWFATEDRGIWTAGDKQRVLTGDLLRKRQKRGEYVSVYIGDSNTDLACLLEVDVGICVRDDPLVGEQQGLKETLERLNIPCRHISELEDINALTNSSEENKALWWAQNFNEIAASALFAQT